MIKLLEVISFFTLDHKNTFRYISFLILLFTLSLSANNDTDFVCPEVTAPSQSFCINNNPTIADLQPTDAIWYSSNDSIATSLSVNTPLTDATVYYAGDQEGTCTVRPQVSVSLTQPAYAGVDNITEFCDADIDYEFPNVAAIESHLLSMLSEGVPQNGSFNPTPYGLSIEYKNANIDEYADFTSTYIVGDPGCQDSVKLTIRVFGTANAGTDTEITLYKDEAQVNLIDYLGTNVTKGGTWSGLNDGIFDPANDPEGDYTYTADGCTGVDTATVSVVLLTPNCPEITEANQSFCIHNNPTIADLQPTDVLWYSSNDSAAVSLPATTPLADATTYYAGNLSETCSPRSQVMVTLTQNTSAGNDVVQCFTNSQIDDMVNTVDDIRPIYLDLLDPGVPRDGTLDPTPSEILSDYYSIGKYRDFTTTYTVGEADCMDSTELTLRIQHKNSAGESARVTFFEDEAPVNLKEYLGGSPSEGGTWSGLSDGIFDPATDAEGDYIYMVDACAGLDTATLSITVVPPGCPTVAESTQSFCRSISSSNTIADLVATDNGGGVAWYVDNTSTTALSTDTDLEDGKVYYAGSSDGQSCVDDRTEVIVNFLDTPNAGKTTSLVFASNDPTVDLRDLIEQTEPEWPVDSGGFMTPETSAGGTIFTPSVDGNWTGERQFTHTVTSSSECPEAEIIVNITITAQPNTGHRLVFLGTNEVDAQNYLDNNDIQSGEGLLVNIWTSNQLEVDSVYRINVDNEDRYYYVNRIYSDPQTDPDLTLTSDTDIEQAISIENSISTFQDVTEFGNFTSNRLDLEGGVTISNEQLLLEGNTMNTTHPLSVTGDSDSNYIKVLDGSLIQSSTQNNLEGTYEYIEEGKLRYLTKSRRAEFNLLTADSSESKLLSLKLKNKVMSFGSRGVQGYYSIRQELDSLPGNLDLVFEDIGLIPVSFQSDTTTVFKGQLQIGDSIASGYDLVVGGAMISESMIMRIEANWPDYVFHKDHKLPSLASIKSYIEKHHHLPGLLTSKEVASKGVNIVETNRTLLEKIEELTLYAIKLHKEIKLFKASN